LCKGYELDNHSSISVGKDRLFLYATGPDTLWASYPMENGLGFDFLQGHNFFFFVIACRPTLGYIQSRIKLIMGWDSIPGRDKIFIFAPRPDQLWSSPSLVSNEQRVLVRFLARTENFASGS
jgi:hypothetical protein